MATPTFNPDFYHYWRASRRDLYVTLAVVAVAASPLLIWPRLAKGVLATDFLPHLYCYLRNPGLVWTHVVSDGVIGFAYLAISVTLGYLVHKARRDIPFHWIFLAFGLFIVACGGTHFVEVVTVWIPAYIFSAAVKVFTAIVSLTTAVVLPFVIPESLRWCSKRKNPSR